MRRVYCHQTFNPAYIPPNLEGHNPQVFKYKYVVDKAVNVSEPTIRQELTKQEVDKLIADEIEVTIT